MAQLAEQRSQLLYQCIDNSSGFYRCPIQTAHRSQMNVVFALPDKNLEIEFLQQATDLKLMHLRGHRIVGGIRASIYNAMPLEGVQTLVNFMQTFQEQYG